MSISMRSSSPESGETVNSPSNVQSLADHHAVTSRFAEKLRALVAQEPERHGQRERELQELRVEQAQGALDALKADRERVTAAYDAQIAALEASLTPATGKSRK